MRPRLLRRLACLAVLVGLVAIAAGPPAHAGPRHRERPKATRTKLVPGDIYVALGDSFAAGPLVPMQEQPWGCLRSTNNYAKLVASRLKLVLRDATCSGAKTKDMTQAQNVSPQPNPPQFDRLDRRVDLVTVQIGGNDIGFSGIAEACVRASFEGTTCRGEYVVNGRDELRARIADAAPKVAAVIAGIRRRAPRAAVHVLGYPGIFKIGASPSAPASCPAMGVGEDDAKYLRGVQEALNAMIAKQARRNGATYVDVYGPSAGRTACDLPVVRWVEPLVPTHAAAPIHPNLGGMAAVADVVVASVAR